MDLTQSMRGESQFDIEANIMRFNLGAVAALDQSGGSTGKSLTRAGIDPAVYGEDQAMMFDLMHGFRTRMMTDEAFLDDRIIAAILFVGSLDRRVNGLLTVDYLRSIGKVPFVKVDKGLIPYVSDGVQLMKDEDGIMRDVETAIKAGAFGTKMRSFIEGNSYRYDKKGKLVLNFDGLYRVLDQQFALAERIWGLGAAAIMEPELSIHARDKDAWEIELEKGSMERLEVFEGQALFKLTPPSTANRYRELTRNPKVMRVLMLSGGLGLKEACEMVEWNDNSIPSFSRALEEGLKATEAAQSDKDFHEKLDHNIASMFAASQT